jgi:polysaccharide deacetylase 2 family uncharacterized protein YibQ
MLMLRLLIGFWALTGLGLVVIVAALAILGAPASPRAKPKIEAHASPSPAAPPLASSPQASSPVPPPKTPPTAPQAAAADVAPLHPADPHAPDPPPPIVAPRTAAALPPVAPVVPPLPASPRPPGSIAPPDPLLLEASQLYPGGRLPRLGPDRRSSIQAYAADFPQASDPRPRVGILVSGLGMNEADSLAAVELLPPMVSLAISPYAGRPDRVIDEARARGHEFMVSIPMEPQGFPLNDPGNRALLTGATLATNAQRLEWSLTRFAGYVGATGALGDLRGERFAASPDQMAPMLDTLADRGLLYIDPRPNVTRLAGAPTQRGTIRAVDLVLDDPAGRAEIDAKLAQLVALAKDRGSAMALAGRPSPILIDRIIAWTSGLAGRGVVLAPVSAIVQMPVAPTAISVRTNLLR